MFLGKSTEHQEGMSYVGLHRIGARSEAQTWGFQLPEHPRALQAPHLSVSRRPAWSWVPAKVCHTAVTAWLNQPPGPEHRSDLGPLSSWSSSHICSLSRKVLWLPRESPGWGVRHELQSRSPTHPFTGSSIPHPSNTVRLSGCRFPHLQNGNNYTCLTGLW